MENANLSRLNEFDIDALLNIEADEPERLFTGNKDIMRSEFRFLAQLWHPDKNKTPGAERVFAHIVNIYDRAKTKLADNDWQIPNRLLLQLKDGSKRSLNYVKKCETDVGDMYIARSTLLFTATKENKDLFNSAARRLENLRFADKKMQEGFAHSLPTVKEHFETDKNLVLVLDKPPELIRLKDYIDFSGGKIDPRHAAWILSGMYNIACYLQWAGIAHNDISPENWFINPATHSGHLLGGWWYAAQIGARMAAVPPRTYKQLPRDVLASTLADQRVDLNLIRLAGREMLGDPAGFKMHRDVTVPRALASWLRLPSSDSAFEDYSTWTGTVLKESFGPRRFVELKLSFDDVYPEKKGGNRSTATRSSHARPGKPSP